MPKWPVTHERTFTFSIIRNSNQNSEEKILRADKDVSTSDLPTAKWEHRAVRNSQGYVRDDVSQYAKTLYHKKKFVKDKNLNTFLSDLAFIHLNIYPNVQKAYVYTKACHMCSHYSLFEIANTQRQQKCPSVVKWQVAYRDWNILGRWMTPVKAPDAQGPRTTWWKEKPGSHVSRDRHRQAVAHKIDVVI